LTCGYESIYVVAGRCFLKTIKKKMSGDSTYVIAVFSSDQEYKKKKIQRARTADNEKQNQYFIV
jgi:hypothetical protein